MKMSDAGSISFFVNGKPNHLANGKIEPGLTLLQYLRQLGLTGTKLGCGEGGCGACTVMLSRFDHEKKEIKHISANACLTPLCSIDGAAVTTIEGIGGMKNGLHPIQRRIASLHGSQCGFCTPGIVMAIYAQFRMKPDSTPHELEESLDGNLCRCTGYRPIIDAAKSLSCCKGETTDHPTGRCCGGSGPKNGGCRCDKTNDVPDLVAHVHNCTEKVLKELSSAEEEKAERGLTEPIFPPQLTKYTPQSFTVNSPKSSWYQVCSFAELLQLKSQYTHAKIVLGNTEVGIEVKFKGMEYSVMINPYHVKELQSLSYTEHCGVNGLMVGASVSINGLRKYILDLSSKLSAQNMAYACSGFIAIRDMLTWFASNHIRNVASVAGNIVTASPISDLNPMLLSCGAQLKLTSLKGSRWLPISNFFLGYRRVDLQPDEIIEAVFIPATEELDFVIPFKQAKRREDDISIVTSGIRFKLKFDNNGDSSSVETKENHKSNGHWVIEDCYIAFGGMSVTSVLAKKTMAALKGQPWSMSTIQSSFQVMHGEFLLPSTVPGGKAEYRMSLVLSFLLKAYYIISLELQKKDPTLQLVSDEEVSGATNFTTAEKPISRGEQCFNIRDGGMQKASPVPHTVAEDQYRGLVGQAMMHKSAEAQVSGEAKYTGDMDLPANALHACLVTSTKAHANILNVDISGAQACAGFVAYFGANDILGSNHIGAVIKDEEVFVTKTVKYYGAVIGVLIADTHEQAVYASRKIKVDYEELPAIITIEDAIAAKSFHREVHTLESGNVAEAMGSADVHVEGTIRIGGQEHFYLETNCTVALPQDNGFLEVYSSTQNCTKTQNFCASVCGIPASKVVAKCKRMGGGFGGKETRSVFIACTAALAAYRLHRPVSINIERDVDMSITGQRHAFIINYKAGCKSDGSLTYLQAELFSNAGYSLDLSLPVMDRALFHCDGPYHWPAIKVTGKVCYTNQPSHTAYRGFGAPQGLMVAETAILHLAQKLNIFPEDIRGKNLYKEGDRTHFGQPLINFYVPSLWNEINDLADVGYRRSKVLEFNRQNKWRKRGLCVLPTKFGISFTAKFMNQGGALVHVYTDGSVLVAHGGTEMGQGLFTKVIQIAARCFQIPDAMVHTSETSTNTVPNASPSAASMSTDLYGMAVLDACEQILARLKPVKEQIPNASWTELISAAYFRRINLSAQGFYIVPHDRCGYDWSKSVEENSKIGTAFNYFTQGSACTEVEIDVLTGDCKVVRADILMDVGKSINPALDIGQIEGAFMQGFGWSTMEEMIWGEKNNFPWIREGQLFTRGPGNYKIPAFNDVPIDFRIHLADTNNTLAVHSSKAIGEPPFFLGASAFFAIKEAINAARVEQGAEAYYALDCPATSERIRMACADSIAVQVTKSTDATNYQYHPLGSF